MSLSIESKYKGDLFLSHAEGSLPFRIMRTLVIIVAALCTISTPISGQPLTNLSSLKPCKNETVRADTACNIAHRFDHSFLLVAKDTSIIRVPLDEGPNVLIPESFVVESIDHDCVEGRFYASGHLPPQIVTAKYDGTDRKPFITNRISHPGDVAVDSISRRLYWSDIEKATIEVASLDNPDVRTVLFTDIRVESLAVDPIRGKLYWIKAKIEMSNLDGTDRRMVHDNPGGLFNTCQVLLSSGELCYTSFHEKKVECIDPRSKQIRRIASDLTDPFGLATTDKMFYWSDLNATTIESINLNGERQQPVSLPEGSSGYIITAVSDMCPLFYSPCAENNGGCPANTICLVSPRDPSGRACKSV